MAELKKRALTRGLGNDPVDAALKGFLLEEETVLVPDEVGHLGVELVALHAALKKVQDVFVIRVGREREAAAVVHVLLELGRLVQTELVDRDLLLLALDVIIFFVLRSAREALPWE